MRHAMSVVAGLLTLTGAAVLLAGRTPSRAAAPDAWMGPPFFRSPAFSPAAAGMGGAAVAWVDDLSALHFNPAGLSGRRFEGAVVTAVAQGGAHGGPAEQLEGLRLLMEDPEAAGRDSLHARLATLGGLAVNGSALGLMAQGEARIAGGQGEGRLASALAVGSGHRLGLRLLGADWHGGTALRLVHVQHVRLDGSHAATMRGYGFTVDLGLRACWGNLVSVGVALHDVAGSLVWRGQDDAPVASRQWLLPGQGVRVGLALGTPDRRARLAGEWGLDGAWAVGLEQRVLGGVLAVRVGRSRDPGQDGHNTAGLGLKLGPLELDAAVLLPHGPGASTAVAALRLGF